MGVIVINFFGGAAALTAANEPAEELILELAGAGGSTRVSGPGDIDITCSPTGGTGPYSFSWAVTEDDDPDGNNSVTDLGTTNVSTWDDLEITCVIPALHPSTAIYTLQCTITDSVGATAVAETSMLVFGVPV